MSIAISVGAVLIFQFSPNFGTGSYFSIPGLRIRFSGGYCIFLILVLVWFHFGLKSDLILEPKITGAYTAQNFQYQNTEVAVRMVFSVLAQH